MSETYDKMRRPPATALREIKGGRLKGNTDINPQWRYEIIDATYGACGTGWKYEIERLWAEPANNGQIMCFSQVKVYVKKGDAWSDPIPGIGGSMLIEQESSGIHVNDEGYKMATTDALSVALKMLGMGADIYAGLWDGAKYKDTPPAPTPPGKLATVKQSLIDWLNVTPKVFTPEQEQYANDMIATNNIAGMEKAIAKAAEKSKKTTV